MQPLWVLSGSFWGIFSLNCHKQKPHFRYSSYNLVSEDCPVIFMLTCKIIYGSFKASALYSSSHSESFMKVRCPHSTHSSLHCFVQSVSFAHCDKTIYAICHIEESVVKNQWVFPCLCVEFVAINNWFWYPTLICCSVKALLWPVGWHAEQKD